MHSKTYPSVIVLICLCLIFQNYTSGTFLSGWDSLHPEFDFALNIKRVIFGVFRQEQGLGAVAAHSHMSDLPRIFFLYISSFVLPVEFLRYFYFFITLVLGPLGVYFFLDRVVFKDEEKNQRGIPAFLGGLFYLLNLGTLQHFYVPFEMFATLYGFLPWLFFFASKFLIEGIKTRKYLILFSVFSLLATPMAYAATLWYVYFLSLVIFLTTLYFFGQKSRLKLKRLIVLLLVTLAINSYWLLPNIYFINNHSADVTSSKINHDFSEKAYAYDTKYANLENVSILRGFLFDWQQYRGNKSDYLLKSWRDYLQNPFVVILGTTFFGIIVFGLFVSITTKDKFGLVFLPVFSFSFIFLIHGQPPLNQVFDFIRDRTTFFSEALRFPWTKFSIIVMFAYAFYFSKGIAILISLFKNTRPVRLAFGIFVPAALIVWMLPAFSGQLISPSMRISIPTDYFNTFDYFKKQSEDKRIAVLPASSFRGWEYYNWGFEGAGFLWFGLKQPVLVRDFDRWNPNNENYYWEISYAISSKNISIFEKVLQKYQISYLFLDKSSINPAFPKSVYIDELKQMITSSSRVTKDKIFGNIEIYKVAPPITNQAAVFISENLPSIGPAYKWGSLDNAYLENGDYMLTGTNPDIYYPFRTLFTGKNQQDLEFSVEDKGDYFMLSKKLPANFSNYFMEVPEINDVDLTWVNPNNLSQTKIFLRDVFFNGNLVAVRIPKVGGLFSAQIEPGNNHDFTLSNLPHSIGYIIKVESNNITGRPLFFWLENLNARRPDIEISLPKAQSSSYFIQPPMEKDGLGYELHFDTISIGETKEKNKLEAISVNPIPYNFLTSIKLKKQAGLIPGKTLPVEFKHPDPLNYVVNISNFNSVNNKLLILSESFENGWLAYEGTPIIGKELKHILVNNWENGWVLDNNLSGKNITIIFLPQYLEFLGFGILAVLFFYLFGRELGGWARKRGGLPKAKMPML